jgi:trimeric autotransporter adhesin
MAYSFERAPIPILCTSLGPTDPVFHNGWLALPHDGVVRALTDLFGNFTPQPPSEHPNGYAALALYDQNHHGLIDARDPIYMSLRIWIDANHDGTSQPEELHTLAELHVDSISLHYRESRMTDEYGN